MSIMCFVQAVFATSCAPYIQHKTITFKITLKLIQNITEQVSTVKHILICTLLQYPIFILLLQQSLLAFLDKVLAAKICLVFS